MKKINDSIVSTTLVDRHNENDKSQSTWCIQLHADVPVLLTSQLRLFLAQGDVCRRMDVKPRTCQWDCALKGWLQLIVIQKTKPWPSRRPVARYASRVCGTHVFWIASTLSVKLVSTNWTWGQATNIRLRVQFADRQVACLVTEPLVCRRISLL